VRDRDHGTCLTDEMLTDYLEGGLDLPIKAASEVHLVSCDDCRNQLAFLMRLLDPEITSGEANTLKILADEWDKKRGTKAPTQSKLKLSKFLVAFATVAAALLLAVSAAWIIRNQSNEPKSAGEVVSLLLTRNRPFESRIAGQPHQPIVLTRGAETPAVSYSLLASEMTRLSANGHEMGRFYLLQKDFRRALQYLVIAEGEVGAHAAVHNDLGVAYLESGDASRLEKAKEEFLHALNDDPSFADAAFNLGLYYERTNASAQAAAQWKHYLELDSKSNWAREARERLQGLSH
jgi:tetratricopeptide (TPR) repeat protein